MLKLKAHSIKTDNCNLFHKRYIREVATRHLDSLKVLDLFAGNNTIWKSFNKDKYFGVEIEKGKGKNLNADNVRVIQSLDLSRFNVIDCDSYGIPIKQIAKIFSNPTLKKGTVIIYTCIGNSLSSLSKDFLDYFKIKHMYRKVKVLFNARSAEFFYAYLYDLGIRTVHEYEEKGTSFNKKYGYFIV